MRCIISPFNNCYQNIASEEYFMSVFDEDIFYLYINSPCIVIGKNQNAYAEINQKYVAEHNIDVVRRLSGGGAVYHDFGNLNFGFIVKNDGKDISAVFHNYTIPILTVLQQLGVNASFSGRNDLVIEEKKISGNAQYRTAGKVLQHGTLLFQSDLAALSNALNVSPLKYQDKSTKSVKSRVTNISEFLSEKISLTDLADAILKEVLEWIPEACPYQLTDADQVEITALADNKYSTWKWVYGNSPKFTYRSLFRFDKGTLEVCLNVVSGVIKELAIYGDFFGDGKLEEFTEALIGLPYERAAVAAAISDKTIDYYVWGLEKEVFLDGFFRQTK